MLPLCMFNTFLPCAKQPLSMYCDIGCSLAVDPHVVFCFHLKRLLLQSKLEQRSCFLDALHFFVIVCVKFFANIRKSFVVQRNGVCVYHVRMVARFLCANVLREVLYSTPSAIGLIVLSIFLPCISVMNLDEPIGLLSIDHGASDRLHALSTRHASMISCFNSGFWNREDSTFRTIHV